jgi:tetratricopeptide (TPR) repeat protein
MINFSKILMLILFLINFTNISFSKENFYTEGVKLFKIKKYDEAKFLFERSIVLDPKHSDSYLYLAKIYKEKENKKKEEKNLEATLLIDPAKEEAILMLMEIALEKTNYSKVKELSKTFSKVCKKMCNQSEKILKDLENLEPKNES